MASFLPRMKKMVSFRLKKRSKDFHHSYFPQNQESHLCHYRQKVKSLNHFLNHKYYFADKHHHKKHMGYLHKQTAWNTSSPSRDSSNMDLQYYHTLIDTVKSMVTDKDYGIALHSGHNYDYYCQTSLPSSTSVSRQASHYYRHIRCYYQTPPYCYRKNLWHL